MRVCFLVGSVAISGGTYVIFQHASFLRAAGYDVTLGVQEAFTDSTLSWHDESQNLRCIPINQAKNEKFDLVIATWWKTAFELSEFSAERYAYFVQSIESRFYPGIQRPLRTLVEMTYRLPVAFLTEAAWIQEHLRSKFGKNAALVRNGIRKDVYRVAGSTLVSRDVARPRVLIEGHFGVPFKNTALAVRLAKEAKAKDIWILTGSTIRWLPGVSQVFSRVPMVKTAEIYRSCDVLLKLSTVEGMFGPPLEIFHCGGTAVVFDVTGHDEYMVDGHNSRVVKTGDLDQVVAVLKRLLNDRDEMARLKVGAVQTASGWPSWRESSAAFSRWVNDTIEEPVSDREKCRLLTDSAFREYAEAERKRLEQTPSVVRGYKFHGFISRLPFAVRNELNQLTILGEVLAGRRKAY